MPSINPNPTGPIPDPPLHTIRGHRVILDADLARLYGVPTKRLNEAVHRNPDRFPSDFAFQLIPEEWHNLNRSQFATGSGATPNLSQIGEGLNNSVDRVTIAGDAGSHPDQSGCP